MRFNPKFALSAIAGLAIAATSIPAMAADVVYEEPPAPAPIVDAAPVSTWEGPYAGLHLGYGFGGRVRDTSGVNGTVGTDGWMGGVFGGYNFQTGSIVYGLEADVNISGVDGGNATLAARTTVDGSVRARVGAAVTNDILVYGTAGGAAERLRVSDAVGSATNTMLGYTVGAGVDAKLTDQIFGRVEYRYSDYGSKTFNLPGVGATNIDSSNHRTTVGIGIRF